MKKFKKILCFVIPFMILLGICFGGVLPLAVREERKLDIRNFLADESGASSAPKSQKGGAIFLEEGATYTMNGGTISNNSNVYGGAIYISNKASFTMTGGTIEKNTATYGGAIYVASGGKCIISGGTIKNNSANVAPAIYVEDGGTLTIGTGAEILDNEIIREKPLVEISEDTTLLGATVNMGGTPSTSNVYLHTAKFGTYPQTYVGNDMNAILEEWYSSSHPTSQKTYEIGDKTWEAYAYTDGEIYARGENNIYNPQNVNYQFKDGTEVPTDNSILWFKVEPINWFILNYDKWQAGEEQMELFSEIALTGNIPYSINGKVSWENSNMRQWLNEKFYEQAFTTAEKNLIIGTQNHTNGFTSDYDNIEPSDTLDNVYLMDDQTIQSGMFGEVDGQSYNSARACGISDFCMSNYSYPQNNGMGYVSYGDNICFVQLLRSFSGNNGGYATIYCVASYGIIDPFVFSPGFDEKFGGIRPVLHLNI